MFSCKVTEGLKKIWRAVRAKKIDAKALKLCLRLHLHLLIFETNDPVPVVKYGAQHTNQGVN